MKKTPQLLAVVSALLLFVASFSFGASEEVIKKYNQLSPIVKLLMNDTKLAPTIQNLMKNCAETNKKEVIRGACQMIVDERNGEILQTENKNQSFKLVSVVDGDIIKIERDGKNVTVRMIGIDAPEGTTTRYGYVEDFGKEATAYLTNLLSGIKEVEIELDDSQGEYDIYQRLLAYIFVNGINVNQKMLEDGYAIEYTYNKPYKYQQSFKTAYVNAENYGKGMFSSVKITQTNNSSPSSTSSSSSETYSCGLKNYCTEMKSCTEAKYYLNTCGLTKLDSDKDGIPCESLCS